jgi:hypothetical protein
MSWMPKAGAQQRAKFVDLPEDLAIELDAYCEALDGARQKVVISKALRRYIDEQLKANPGIERSFIAARDRLRAARGKNSVTSPTVVKEASQDRSQFKLLNLSSRASSDSEQLESPVQSDDGK